MVLTELFVWLQPAVVNPAAMVVFALEWMSVIVYQDMEEPSAQMVRLDKLVMQK